MDQAIDPDYQQHYDHDLVEHDFIENHSHSVEQILEEKAAENVLERAIENQDSNPLANITGVNVQELFENFWQQASASETYANFLEQIDQSLEGKVEIPFGFKPHHLLLAGFFLLIWTIFVFFLGYLYARIFKSKLVRNFVKNCESLKLNFMGREVK